MIITPMIVWVVVLEAILDYLGGVSRCSPVGR
jgi:hypothetical protein